MYEPRIARFQSVDPLRGFYPELSPYQYASLSPIQFIDIDGLEGGKPPNTLDLDPVVIMGPRSSASSSGSSFGSGNMTGMNTASMMNLFNQVYQQSGAWAQGAWNQVLENHSLTGERYFVYKGNYENSYEFGRKVGNAIAAVEGGVEIAAGVILTGGGFVAAPASGGASLAISAEGVTIVGIGTITLKNAMTNMSDVNETSDNLHQSNSESGSNLEKMGKQKGSKTEKMPDDVAKQLKIKDKRKFMEYLHKIKKSEGRGGKDNYSWDELIGIGKEYLEKYGNK